MQLRAQVLRTAMGLFSIAVSGNVSAIAQVLPGGSVVMASRRYGSVYGPVQASGLTNLISGPDLGLLAAPVRGNGPSLAGESLAVEALSPTLVVAAPARTPGRFRVDLATGDRTLLAGTDGPLWTGGGDMIALDSDTLLAIADDFDRGMPTADPKLLRYRVSTGETTLISSVARGNGVVMFRPRALARIDDDTVAVVEFGQSSSLLYSVNLTTGDRTVISTIGTAVTRRYTATAGVRSATDTTINVRGVGPRFALPCRGVAYVANQVIVSGTADTTFAGGFLRVNVVTGDRTLLAGTARDAGTQVVAPFAVGSDVYAPNAPTSLRTLDDRAITCIETFGPDRVWVWDVVANRVRVAADLTPQVIFQLIANRAEFSGMALTPCGGGDPAFTVQPQETSVTSCVGGIAELRVVTSTPGPFRYVWNRDGMAIDQGMMPSAGTATLSLRDLETDQSGTYTCFVSGACGSVESAPVSLNVLGGCCDSIDFNNNTVFPEDQDVIDFFNVLAGQECPTCNDIDFNNNTVFPEDQDVIDFFTVLAGGECS